MPALALTVSRQNLGRVLFLYTSYLPCLAKVGMQNLAAIFSIHFFK